MKDNLLPPTSKGTTLHHFIITVLLIILAAVLRIWPLQGLELRIPWVTFYPALMAAALYGGFNSGILATILSALTVTFWSPTGTPFIDDPGDWLGMAVFCINGTLISWMSGAMHRAQKQAQEARMQADSANKAKSTFLANMSHELRTPLNSILGFTDLLRKSGDFPPEKLQKLDIIYNSGKNLLTLINNILDISKIETGHMKCVETLVNLPSILQEIESMISVKIAEKNIEFVVNQSPDLPLFILTDMAKLRQILINLVYNAVKFTHQGTIAVNVSLTGMKPEGQDAVRFEVKDTGIGISKDDADSIFEPFTQAKNHHYNLEGTGLGLSICRQFAEVLGGTLGMQSELGKGSVFFFVLPLKIPGKSLLQKTSESYRTVIGIKKSTTPFRLLIADDQPENRLLLMNLLEPFGFELRQATNGVEAVAQFESWHPHLVWMDIKMPVMDGMEAIRRIRANPSASDTRIIALTAHALEEELKEIRDSGCDEVLQKPFQGSEIFETLEKQLGIEFIYSTLKNDSPEPETIDIEHFEKLPQKLTEKLIKYAIILDTRKCLDVCAEIEKIDILLGLKIRKMIENLDYKELQSLLDRLKTNEKEEN